MYAASAGLLTLLSFAVRRGLPHAPRTDDSSYRDALRSVWHIVRDEPVLRQRMVMGACNMAGFSLLWTGSALLLGDEPYGFSEGTIGLFGLVGVAGVLVAPQAGRLADAGFGRVATTGFSLLLLLSWPLLWLGGAHLPALLVGILLFDIGVHGAQISNPVGDLRPAPGGAQPHHHGLHLRYFAGAVLALPWPPPPSARAADLACAAGAILAAIRSRSGAATRNLGTTARDQTQLTGRARA